MYDEMMVFDVDSFSGDAHLCKHCQTAALYFKNIPAGLELAPLGLECLYISRCYGCGDIRLIGTFWDPADPHDLRSELKCLADLMSEVAAEGCNGR